jgi:hypothetical protein
MEHSDMVRNEVDVEKSNSSTSTIPDEKNFVKVKQRRHKIYASISQEGRTLANYMDEV